MNRKSSNFIASVPFFYILFLVSFTNLFPQTVNKMEPPKAEKIKKELTSHGHTRIDYYYWLNERENPKVIDHLNAENLYTQTALRNTETLQEDLYNEMIARIKQTDESVPYLDNGYFYYSRFEEGKEYPIYARKKTSLDAPEEILLNVNEMAEGFGYYNVAGLSVSPDNTILAYGVDTLSRRIYDIYFKNLLTGEISKDIIPNTTGSSVWANDNKTLFYSIKDETLRPHKIMKHKLERNYSSDETIFHEEDQTFMAFVYKTKSKQYIMTGSFATLSTEFRFLNANDPDGQFRTIQPRERKLEYSVDHFGDKFYIRTNLDAKNFRLMQTPIDKTSKENWTEVIPHRPEVFLENTEIFKDFLVLEEREKGLTKLRIIRWDGNGDFYLDFGEATYTAYISTNRDFDTKLLRYGYSSLTTPNSTYDFNMITKEKILLKQDEIIGEFNSANYHAERLYAPADDGTMIPISLVYRKGVKQDGNNPLLLYGYGSYGISTDPYFSSVRLSLLDRGFIYAIAHVRGGQELGRQWYEDGKFFNKKNTFTDFIACGNFLVANNYTNNDKMFAMGGSAGGLLVGAVANIAPDLFKGILAAVPFVDVVTTMLDESIPLTTGEYDEWGNPNDKAYYDYMLSYSPYDNVEVKNYPSMLITTGLHDSQVQYWEPAKWVAKLREMKTDDNLVLLHTNMEAGHGGASGRFKRFKEIALQYAFMLDQLGRVSKNQ